MSLDIYLSKIFEDANKSNNIEQVKQEQVKQEQVKQEQVKQEQVKQEQQIIHRRRPLPVSVRDSVWNHYIGEDINKHRCLCCKKILITNRQFQVGHVISVKHGGTDEINNLRPICSPCNHSMGTKNMVEFVKTYGYYIG
jgi:5-methylcytosine-specific restriction endonuclease McrA